MTKMRLLVLIGLMLVVSLNSEAQPHNGVQSVPAGPEVQALDVTRPYVVERSLGTSSSEVLCYGYPGMGFSEARAGVPINVIPYKEITLNANGTPKTTLLSSMGENAATTVHISYRAARTQREILDSMGFSVSLAARYKLVSGNASFSQRMSSLRSENAISICMTASVTFGLEVPVKAGPDLTLTESAARLLKEEGENAFYQKYGTHHVSQAERGARIVLVFNCVASSEESFRQMQAAAGFRASSPLAKVEGKSALEKLHKERKQGWDISCEVFGANVDFDEVRKHVKTFLSLGEPDLSSLENGCSGLLKGLTRSTADYVSFHAVPHVISAKLLRAPDSLWLELLSRDNEADAHIAVCEALTLARDIRERLNQPALPVSKLDEQLQAARELKRQVRAASLATAAGTAPAPAIPKSTGVATDALKWVADRSNWSIVEWLAFASPDWSSHLLSPGELATVTLMLRTVGAQLEGRPLEDAVLKAKAWTSIDIVDDTRDATGAPTDLSRRDWSLDLAPLCALPALTSVTIRNGGTVRLPSQEQMASVKWSTLNVSWCRFSGDSDLRGLRCLTDLKQLDLSACRLRSIDFLNSGGVVNAYAKLTTLDLSDNIAIRDFGPLKELAPNLRKLRLSNTLIAPADLTGLTLSSLETLCLELTPEFRDPASIIEALSGAGPALTRLELSWIGTSKAAGHFVDAANRTCWHDGILTWAYDDPNDANCYFHRKNRAPYLKAAVGARLRGLPVPANLGLPSEWFPVKPGSPLTKACVIAWDQSRKLNANETYEVCGAGRQADVVHGEHADQDFVDPFWAATLK